MFYLEQSGLIATQRDKKPFLDMAINALTDIFKPTTPFLTGHIMEILFDGIPIDCSSDSLPVKLLCTGLKERKGIRSINDTHLAFSALGGVSMEILSVLCEHQIKFNDFSLKYKSQTPAALEGSLFIVALKTFVNWVRLSLLMAKKKLTIGMTMANVTKSQARIQQCMLM